MARAYIEVDGKRLYPPELVTWDGVPEGSEGVVLDGEGKCADRWEDGVRGVPDDVAREAEADDSPYVLDPGGDFDRRPIDGWEHTDYKVPAKAVPLSELVGALEGHNDISVAGMVFYTVRGIVEDTEDEAPWTVPALGWAVSACTGDIVQTVGFYRANDLPDGMAHDMPDARLCDLIEAGVIDPMK